MLAIPRLRMIQFQLLESSVIEVAFHHLVADQSWPRLYSLQYLKLISNLRRRSNRKNTLMTARKSAKDSMKTTLRRPNHPSRKLMLLDHVVASQRLSLTLSLMTPIIQMSKKTNQMQAVPLKRHHSSGLLSRRLQQGPQTVKRVRPQASIKEKYPT